MVPPVTNSTGTPVSAVNFLATVSATRSRQLPPQILITSLSWACAGTATASTKSANRKRFMCNSSVRSLHDVELLHFAGALVCTNGRGSTIGPVFPTLAPLTATSLQRR